MSAEQICEIQSQEVETFREAPADDWSDEDSSGESIGGMKATYSCSDITEELIKNGDTLRRDPISLYENVKDPIYENIGKYNGGNSNFYLEGDFDWSSSEFDDSDLEQEQPADSSGPKSLELVLKKKMKKLPPKMSCVASNSQDRLTGVSKGKSILEGFKRNARQNSMLDKISRLGQRRPRPEESDREADADLEPLNFRVGSKEFQPASLPATLPESITPVQMKRRLIMSMIVESEKSYLFALKRLIEEYQLPLMQAQPPIIERKHVRVIFHKVRDIIQCHLLFHGELHDVATRWDQEEKIGDVFVASFSKSTVFEAYSSFVNNFPTAMERAKKQARMKSAFNTFLKDKLDTSRDKLSLFGLMVKPVQRFPQFIMLIQDLLKNTPKDHPDRLSLQLALTELEMLTDRLNETKKECESHMEAKRLSKVLHLGGTSKQEVKSLFIRQDDVMQHKVRDGETESKLKRLFMLSDQLVCASVNKHKENLDPGESLMTSGEKFVVTWSAPIKDIEVVDPTLPSLKSHPLSRQSSGSQTGTARKSGKLSLSPAPSIPTSVNPYRKDMDNMLHDLNIFENMVELHTKLKLKYDALPLEVLKGAITSLELLIRQKIDIDKNILTISIPNSRGRKSVTLEFPSLTMKHDWLIELQSAKLATDPNNFPAWFLSENDPLFSRNPRFMTALKMDGITKEDKKMTLMKTKKRTKDELNCCTYVTLPCHNKPGSGIRHLWVCMGGRAAIVSLHTNQPFVMECFNITDGNLVAAECISESNHDLGVECQNDEDDFRARRDKMKEIVWMVSDDNKIFRVPAIQADNQTGNKPIKLDGAQVKCMKYLDDRVYLGTVDGILIIYSRNNKGEWNFASPQKLSLGKKVVSFLMVADDNSMWASCSSTVHILGLQTHPTETEIKQVYLKASHLLTNDVHSSGSGTPAKNASPASIECMVKAGVGLLVSFTDQSTVRLFHSESFQHLQDINISSAVTQLLDEKGSSMKPDMLQSSSLSITCMLPNKGILYIGTNLGFVLTLPLPKLNGMPQFRQRPAISFQGHVGPVKFLASINCSLVDGTMAKDAPKESPKHDKSCRVSSDTLIGEEHLTPPSGEDAEPMGSNQNGDQEPLTPSPLNQNLSTSTPDLTSLQADLATMKCQQVDGLYESLLRGVMENSDDTAVLQRIASTPLPHRRHRIQNMLKSVWIQDSSLGGSTASPVIREDEECVARNKSGKKSNAKLRHSMTEVSETSTPVETIPLPSQPVKTVTTSECTEEEEEGRGQSTIITCDTNDDKEVKADELNKNGSDESSKLDASVAIEPDQTKETLEQIAITSHLNKSVSSASDTPSQKSSSSASSSAKQKTETSAADGKFSSFSRFSIPSNTAMISSNLTTTPKSRAIVFASAGKGYIPWNSSAKGDGSPDKPCLLLWMC